MNFRDLINKLDAVDSIIENNQKAFRQDPEGAIARAQAGANGMGLLGAMGGYALANMGRGNQNSGNMQPGGQGNTVTPMQPGTTTTTTGPAVPVGQPYLDTAHTINYNKPNGNIAGAPSDTTNKSPRGNDALEDADIKKLNALVDQLEKTKVPEKDTSNTGNNVSDQNTSPSKTTKQNLLPVDPEVKALQKAILAIDPTALSKYGADGRMGNETRAAIAKYPEIAAKYKAGGAAAAPTDTTKPGFASNGDGAAFGNPNITTQGQKAKTTITPDANNAPMSAQQRLAQQQVARMKAKADQLAAAGQDSGTFVGGKLQPANEINFADQLIESFGYQTEGEATLGQQAAVGAGTYAGAKGIGKMLGKAIPGAGLAFGAADAYNRAKKGDWVGAGLAGASGIASLVPGIGTAASLGLDAANIARDYKHGEYDDALPTGMQSGHAAAAPAGTTMPPDADPKVFLLQKQLIAKGAKNIDGTPLVADGKMGKNTQAAMKQFGVQAETVAENIASLRDRLAMIEAEQYADEGSASELVGKGLELGKDAWSGIKNFTKGAASPNVTPLPNVGLAKNVKYKGPGTAFKAGQAVGRNPGKTALAGAALGTGAGIALTPGGSKETPDTAPVVSTGSNNGNIAASPSDIDDNQPDVDTGPTPEQQALIDQIKELMGHDYGDDPKWDASTSHAQSVIDKYTGADPLQQAMDQGHASGATNVAQTPSQGIAAMPSMPKPGQPGNPISGAPPGLSVVGAIPGTPGATPVVSNAAKMLNFNPYQGADAAKFASFTPAQQAWLTKGGGVPDISGDEKNNPILYRMKSANPDTNNPTKTTSNWEESINESDKELARWLKIARG